MKSMRRSCSSVISFSILPFPFPSGKFAMACIREFFEKEVVAPFHALFQLLRNFGPIRPHQGQTVNLFFPSRSSSLFSNSRSWESIFQGLFPVQQGL